MDYPANILRYEKNSNCFFLRDEAAQLLNLVTGVSLAQIKRTRVFSRFSGFRMLPWYRISPQGGGAITLGNCHTQRIILTENYFSNAYAKYSFGSDPIAWLRILSHEIRHLDHIARFDNWLIYLLFFGWQYLSYFSHDTVPEEIYAEEGTRAFSAFHAFTEKSYGRGSFIRLFAELPVNDKLIAQWYAAFLSTLV